MNANITLESNVLLPPKSSTESSTAGGAGAQDQQSPPFAALMRELESIETTLAESGALGLQAPGTAQQDLDQDTATTSALASLELQKLPYEQQDLPLAVTSATAGSEEARLTLNNVGTSPLASELDSESAAARISQGLGYSAAGSGRADAQQAQNSDMDAPRLPVVRAGTLALAQTATTPAPDPAGFNAVVPPGTVANLESPAMRSRAQGRGQTTQTLSGVNRADRLESPPPASAANAYRTEPVSASPSQYQAALEVPVSSQQANPASLSGPGAFAVPGAQAAPGLNPTPNIEASSPALTVPGSISVQVGSADWDGAIGEHLMHLARTGQKTAELNLTPPHLGRMQVQLTLDNEQASVQFTSAHASVREALEAALPRLRDMMADSGLELVDANVADQNTDAHAQSQAHSNDESRTGKDPEESSESTIPPTVADNTEAGRLSGLVDAYV